MNGLLITKTKSGIFTNMSEIFTLLPERELNKNWLISDYDCAYYPLEEIDENQEYVWIDGNHFKKILPSKGPQFIWGVFTSFEKSITLEEVKKHPIPTSEFNTTIWDPKLPALHPLSETEIISWDASYLIIKSEDSKLLDRFKLAYPEHIDFKDYLFSD